MKPLNPRILFVEDHEDTRELLALILRDFHYDVATAATIDESLELAKSNQFNLFILDSWLIDGSGIDLCKQIRQFDDRTPILFYSGAAYEKDKHLAMSSGAQGYLIKPADVPELLATIKGLIKIDFESIHDSDEEEPGHDGLPRRLAAANKLA
jgi:DNA-binding response OmpR family regulator